MSKQTMNAALGPLTPRMVQTEQDWKRLEQACDSRAFDTFARLMRQHKRALKAGNWEQAAQACEELQRLLPAVLETIEATLAVSMRKVILSDDLKASN